MLFLFLKSHDPFIFANNTVVFPKFDPWTATVMALSLNLMPECQNLIA
jgi:hypothetical protein